MMAAGIFVFSAAALLQFFISYCRSLIAASSKQVLSPEVKDVTGIQRFASGDDFKRVMQLLQLCPESPEDRNSVQAIGAYFGLLNFLRSTLARVIPSMRAGRTRNAGCALISRLWRWSAASPSAGTCSPSRWTPETAAKQLPPTVAEMLPLSLQSFSFLCLTFPARVTLTKFSPHRSGRVRSAKLTGDKNMFAVWRDIAVKRSRLQFL